MSEIKRWDCHIERPERDMRPIINDHEDDNGRYVTYYDHLAAMREKDAELEIWGRRVGSLSAALELAEAQRDALRLAAKNYYMRYCQDEADDEGCEITGCSYQQHLDARALLNAIHQIEQEKGA